MSDQYLQSSINEVRDQLSLDQADGRYLNAVSSNLGMTRPVFGFSDATWRALVKVLALRQKQVKNAFEDALAVLFGPRFTVATTLAADVTTGDTSISLTSTEGIPQVGTLILDRDLPVEESIEYDFIDYGTNSVHLSTPAINAHTAVAYGETKLQLSMGIADDIAYVFNTSPYPGSGNVSTLVQDYLGNDGHGYIDTLSSTPSYLQFNTTPGVAMPVAVPEHVHSTVLTDYSFPSEFVSLASNDKFQDSGIALLGSSTTFTDVGGSSATSVNVAASTFTLGKLQGYKIQFLGNITPGLVGEASYIAANTAAVITLHSALSTPPVAGDTFYILPIVEYDKNNDSLSAIRLKKPIYDIPLSAGDYVEDMGKLTTVRTAQVQVEGTKWDVIQSNPRLVELLLPAILNDENNVRSASYVHTAYTTHTALVDTVSTTGDTVLSIDDLRGWPVAGQALVDVGDPLQEYIGYYRPKVASLYVEAGSSSTTMNMAALPTLGPILGETVYIEDKTTDITISRTITSFGATSVSFADPIPNLLFAKFSEDTTEVWIHDTASLVLPNSTLVNSHDFDIDIYYYNVAISSTLQDGKIWTAPTYRFPGPYLHNITSQSTEGASASTTLGDLYSGPTKLVMGVIGGGNALEVEDATAFPLSSTFNVSIGRGTTAVTTITASSVSLKQRALAAVQVGSSIGDTTLDLVSLSGIPAASNYRVIVDRGGANEEVVYVRSVVSATAVLTVDPMTKAHLITEPVELLADVVVVSAITDVHDGQITYGDRVQRWPVLDHTSFPTFVTPVYDTISVASTAGFSSGSGTAVLNYGNANQDIHSKIGISAVAGATVLSLNSTTAFPTSYPYEIIVSEGTRDEERCVVALNTVGLGQLTITHGLKNAQPEFGIVRVKNSLSQVLSYTSASGGLLSFSSGIMLNSTHRTNETVIRSSGLSSPRVQGYDFPLRMPSDLLTRLQYVIDIIRAAGIKVEIIESR